MAEVFHDAIFAKERAQEYFASGVLTLRDRANAEQLYLGDDDAGSRGWSRASGREHPEIWADIEATLVDRYFCNFSVFQSLPDNWAIDQLFPIMPIHRLTSSPPGAARSRTSPATPTGSSTGSPAGGRASRRSSCTPPRTTSPTSSASSSPAPTRRSWATCTTSSATPTRCTSGLTEQGYEITDLVHGDTVTEVLNYVQFHARRPAGHLPPQGDRRAGPVPAGGQQFIADYVAGLEGYTYLEGEELPGPDGAA